MTDSAGNLSPRHLAGLAAGAALILAGAILATRRAGDPRGPLRYVAGTALGWLDAAGEWAADRRSALWLMIPVLLLAAFLRFYHLTFQSLWLDELMTWWRSSYNDLPTVIRSVESDVWPPGYSLWAWLIIHTVGATDFTLRFPAALAGVMSAAATYALGRRLGGHLSGLLGALLISVLEISIYYGQEARPYAGLILFSALSTYFWLGVVRRPARAGVRAARGEWSPGGTRFETAGYVITALLAMYWNYYGIVLVAFQGLGALIGLIRRPKTWPKLIGIYAVIAVGYLPWIAQTFGDLGRDVYLAVKPGGYTDELMAFFRALFNLEQNYVLAAIALVAAALIAEGIMSRRGRKIPWAAWLILLGWLILPFTLTYVRSLVSVSTFLHRYLLISLPAAVLLPALALARLPIKRWIAPAAMLLASAILLNNLVRHWDYYTRPTKAQFREAVDWVVEADPATVGRAILVGYTGYHGTQDLFDYYFAQAHSDRHVQLEAGFGDEMPQVEKMATESESLFVWVIAAQNKPADSFLDAMGRRYELIHHETFEQAGVWLYGVK